MGTPVTVDISVKAEIAKLEIDEAPVTLTDGEASVTVPPGKHDITWAVRGAAGTKYSIAISAPKEAAFSHTDTFDEEQFDTGVKTFTVNEAE